MIEFLAGAAVLSAVGAIYADRGEARPAAFYALKPLTTVLIIGIAWLREPADPGYQLWILVGLSLSLAGDVALMFHGNRWFMAGLSSFLLAHLAFIAAFLSGLDGIHPPWWSLASPLIGFAYLPRIWSGAGRLRPAVLVYGLVLCGMVVAAAARYADLPGAPALLAVAGAVLFQLSDSVLGYRKFVRAHPAAQPVILSTYWLAIGLLAFSV